MITIQKVVFETKFAKPPEYQSIQGPTYLNNLPYNNMTCERKKIDWPVKVDDYVQFKDIKRGNIFEFCNEYDMPDQLLKMDHNEAHVYTRAYDEEYDEETMLFNLTSNVAHKFQILVTIGKLHLKMNQCKCTHTPSKQIL